MCCCSWGQEELDTTEQLNLTELKIVQNTCNKEKSVRGNKKKQFPSYFTMEDKHSFGNLEKLMTYSKVFTLQIISEYFYRLQLIINGL